MKHLYLFALLAVGAWTGCPPQPMPTSLDLGFMAPVDMAKPKMLDMPPNEYGLTACASPVNVSFADVCDGMFTVAGLACAHCSNTSACLDTDDVIYCASGNAGCMDDAACVFVSDGVEGPPSAAKAKKKAKRPIHKIPMKLKKRS